MKLVTEDDGDDDVNRISGDPDYLYSVKAKPISFDSRLVMQCNLNHFPALSRLGPRRDPRSRRSPTAEATAAAVHTLNFLAQRSFFPQATAVS